MMYMLLLSYWYGDPFFDKSIERGTSRQCYCLSSIATLFLLFTHYAEEYSDY